MTYTAFANTDQTLVALYNGQRLPILGWYAPGCSAASPLVPALTGDPWDRRLYRLPVLDTKTNLVYSQKGLMTLEAYEESING